MSAAAPAKAAGAPAKSAAGAGNAAAAAKNADGAAAADAPAAPASGRKKKLLLIAVASLLLMAIAGGAAWWFLRGAGNGEAIDEAATEAADAADTAAHAEKAKPQRHGPPAFVPLDPFTVNLADRETERYAQVGITLELEDAKDAEIVKQYMPAIRNNILMVLAHKTSAELLGREGKRKLAEEVRSESLRALGHDAEATVRAVQFSNFIIQ